MPIHCPITIRDLSQAEFDERDALVMRCAYAAQNALGRLCDEPVYENDLALRLRAERLEVHTQLPVTVTHADFKKLCRCDLVASDALYELKTALALAGADDAQILHYAMLLGVRHGKLLNFRTPKVQGRLRCNALTAAQRRQVVWDVARWRPLSPECAVLQQRLRDLVLDWGAFLDCRLYDEALVHFCGGDAGCVRRVPVSRDGIELGSHRVQRHADELFFLVTALTAEQAPYESHIRRLLGLTGWRGVQWMNFNHQQIEFTTLERLK